jgi:RHS repeat-associated protein
MKRTNLLFLFAVFCFAVIASAQVQTGAPPFGTFTGGPDIINLANLNYHLTVPIIHKKGRGTDFIYDLSFDSSVWLPAGVSGSQSWQPVWNWGWTGQTQITTGYATYTSINGDCGTGRTRVPYHIYTFRLYNDQFGTSHPISLTVNDSAQRCSTPVGSFTASKILTDGSAYTVTVDASPSATVFASNGTKFIPPLLQGAGSGSFTDANGNQVSVSATGVFTDTLGTTVLTVAGAPPNPVTFTYTTPSNTSAAYRVIYTPVTVQTGFGCSGITEYGPAVQNLITEIDLPDQGVVPSDRYLITYEATPGFPGNVTGRIASITLPTGGVISYSYSGGSNGITCADGSAATLQRVTPDGTWTYAHTENGSAWTTTVTDPQSNQTIYNFQGTYQTERKVYQGTTTLLEDDVTCYNGNIANCNTTAITLPITQQLVTKTLGTQVCQHIYKYNSSGLMTEQDDYDYGNGSPGLVIRKQHLSYASLGNNIIDKPLVVDVTNSSDGLLSQTTFSYDAGSVTPTNGTPQHVGVTGSRGNLTGISVLVALAGTSLTKSFTYFDTGNMRTATDTNNALTTYNYADAITTCGNAFPTSVSEPLGLSASMTFNCTGGIPTSVTDENSGTASTTYQNDVLWRPDSLTDQLGNQTNLSYLSPTRVESSMAFNGGASVVDFLKTVDVLGRAKIVQQREAPGSSNFDSAESDYDSLGRPSRNTVPYVGTAGGLNGSGPAITQTYDALDRPLVITDGGGGTVSFSYPGNDILQTIGPAPAGENTKRRQSEYNSIGQLTSVCEITSASDSGTCGQTTAATGYWTKYTYDAAGRLLTVSQNAQSGTQVQTRTFTYDFLGRMTSERNPETGATAIAYIYDTDATCGTSNGDLVKRTDAAGNVTCYAYDQGHRRTSMTYPSGPNAANTPNKYFVFDAATVNGVAMSNARARLAEAYTATCPTCPKITDEGFSYTARGEVSDVYESTPNSGGYFHVSEQFWANGATKQISGLAGLPAFTYAVDGQGRPSSVSAGTGQNPVTSIVYNVASQATQVNFGSGDNDAFQFDSNTLRMTQYKYTIGATPQSVIGNLTWNANGTLGNLSISDPFNAANTQNCIYGYDDLVRLAAGNCGSAWSQSFSYDPFGNISKSGSAQFQPGYDFQTNHMISATYDTTGDVLNDGLHSYAWNSDTRPVTIDTITVTFDAVGRMVEQSAAGVNTQFVYDGLGNKLALMNGISTVVKGFAPLPSGGTAVYDANGLQNYRHADWLGSSRFASTPGRTMYSDLAFAPFGEQYAQAGTVGLTGTTFAGNHQDVTTNLYDAAFREYGIQGRWPSPDPAGVDAADPANPQSWNRYAYVLNNPEALVDPSGLGAGCVLWGIFERFGTGPWYLIGTYWVCDPNTKSGSDKGGGGKAATTNAPSCIPLSSLNWSQKAQLSAAQFYANWLGGTWGFGVGGDGGVGVGPKGSPWNVGVGGSAATMIVADSSGNSGILNSASIGVAGIKHTKGAGGSWWGYGLTAGPSVLVSPNPITKLEGVSGSISGGGGAILGGGGSLTTNGALTVTVGIGLGAEGGFSPQFGKSWFTAFCKK